MSLPDWARAFGEPLFSASIRTRPEEFDVTEELGFEPSGDGEHDFLFVEKTATNTEWLARQLAAFADVPAKDVGYSGMKDRHAVTRQWFSVPRWNQPDWSAFEMDGIRILDVRRNLKKLRRGAHQSNRFRIVLRGDVSDANAIEERLRTIAQNGVPNYFGEQRFGRGGANVALADSWAAGKRLPRNKRGIAISSARSFMFNETLAERVAKGNWYLLEDGDTVNLDGTNSVFEVERVDSDLRQRCESMDINPAGLLWGDGACVDDAPPGHQDWLKALQKARVDPSHRSLRLRVADLEWEFGEQSLTLEFRLGRGAFATSVMRELALIESTSDRLPTNEN